MTDEELQAIRKRVEAATPGPWREDNFTHRLEDVTGEPLCAADVDGADAGLWNRADGIFVVHARTDVPALLAEVERLKADLELSEARCGTMGNMLRYISFVAGGSESTDPQLSVDRLKGRAEAAEAQLRVIAPAP
jgi:hypothetical protein